MNTKNNRRAQETVERIVRAVYYFIADEKRPLSKITVREVCERAQINRSTFYAHFLDVYDVAERVEKTMAEQAAAAFVSRPESPSFMQDGFIDQLRFIQKYSFFYLIYFEETNRSHAIELLSKSHEAQLQRVQPQDLGCQTHEELRYCQEYFNAGVSALIYRWLKDGCKETAEEIYEIIRRQCGQGWPFGSFTPPESRMAESEAASSAR